MSTTRKLALAAEVPVLAAVFISAQRGFTLGVWLGIGLAVVLGYVNFADGRDVTAGSHKRRQERDPGPGRPADSDQGRP